MIIILLCFVLSLVEGQSSEMMTKYQNVLKIREDTKAFDLDQAPAFGIVARNVENILRETVSEFTDDVSILARFARTFGLALFDAIAPYTEKAIGFKFKIPRRPLNERTLINQNIVITYAWYRVMLALVPSQKVRLGQMMEDLGLDPNDMTQNDLTPIGIGNKVGTFISIDTQSDGMNQLGDQNGAKYTKIPFKDYTGYQPINTPYRLYNPTRWQPAIKPLGNGRFASQIFVTPQLSQSKPFTYLDPNKYRVVPHGRTLQGPYGLNNYKRTTDEVLKASATLNDEQKLLAEFFADKVRSVFGSIVAVIDNRNLDIEKVVLIETIANFAFWDTAIVVWNEKRRWDAVRPVTAIQYLYGNIPLIAWGGPYKGTVNDIPANEWRPYLADPDHPEYPSATTAVCYAHTAAMQTYLADDTLDWNVTFAKGSSRIEPESVPAEDLTVQFKTFTDFAFRCGQSRLWSGAHFQDAIDNIKQISTDVGTKAARLVMDQWNGKEVVPIKHTNPYPYNTMYYNNWYLVR